MGDKIRTSRGSAVKLPGFGLLIDDVSIVPDSDGRRSGFPGPVFDTVDSMGIQVRERRMLDFINKITDKPGWQKQVFDEATVGNWRAEACVFDKGLDDDYLSRAMFDYCLKELRDKAGFYQKTSLITVLDCELAVVKSDTIVPESLADSLRSFASVLENVPDRDKDWRPGSREQVLDLLHPSVFPLVYGRSRALPVGTVPLEDCARYIGRGDPVSPRGHWKQPGYKRVLHDGCSKSRIMPWGNYQWLPSNIRFTETGVPKIDSYIHNLHPQAHPDLYTTLESFVAHSIPLWNECLSWFEERFRLRAVNDGEGAPDEDSAVEDGEIYESTEGDGDEVGNHPVDSEEGSLSALIHKEPEELDYYYIFTQWLHEHKYLLQNEPVKFHPRSHWETQPEHHPTDLQKDFLHSGLQVIFKLTNIHLTPEKPVYEGGPWHIEGCLNEPLCATSFYYYDDENITESHLEFRQSLHVDSMDMHNRSKSLDVYYGVESGAQAIQRLGSVLTCQGRLLAFPNVIQHRVQPFRLADPKRPGHRKILTMFLLDPYYRVLSTANVPPQRKDWWASEVRKIHPFTDLPQELFDIIVQFVEGFPMSWEEALKVRSELMVERRDLMDHLNEDMEDVTFLSFYDD